MFFPSNLDNKPDEADSALSLTPSGTPSPGSSTSTSNNDTADSNRYTNRYNYSFKVLQSYCEKYLQDWIYGNYQVDRSNLAKRVKIDPSELKVKATEMANLMYYNGASMMPPWLYQQQQYIQQHQQQLYSSGHLGESSNMKEQQWFYQQQYLHHQQQQQHLYGSGQHTIQHTAESTDTQHINYDFQGAQSPNNQTEGNQNNLNEDKDLESPSHPQLVNNDVQHWS